MLLGPSEYDFDIRLEGVEVPVAFPIASVVIQKHRDPIFIHEVASEIVYIIEGRAASMAVDKEEGVVGVFGREINHRYMVDIFIGQKLEPMPWKLIAFFLFGQNKDFEEGVK